MRIAHLFLVSKLRVYINGATNHNLALISITRSPQLHSPTPGNVAGQRFFFLLNNGLAGSWNWLQKKKGIAFGNIDAIVEHIQQRLASHQPQPSLLHGDLWSGNCALGPDGPYIFDPACYWGDRECDLAMLPLHTEQPPQIYDGYQSVSPLPADFLERQPVYQLYTLLNRARLFGGQHLVIAQQSLDRLLAA